MMDKKLFTLRELKELATPYPHLILQHIRQKNMNHAKCLCNEMRDSQVLLHDFFAELCTVLWSWVGENFGEESVDEMFRYIFDQTARRQFFDAACAEAPPHLSVILLAKSWRAHSCFETGEYPGKFSIHEDDEKFTFRLDPCGSGLRLWKKGFYRHPKGGKVSEKKRTWTYNRKGFPYYCIHCPFLNELLPYESPYGSIMWPVDPPKGPDDVCQWHIYKDRNDIPENYYKRLGIEKIPVKTNKYLTPGRMYFRESQLIEMARPVTDRIIECIDAGDLMMAKKLCKEVKDEFLVLHDLYVNMLAASFSFISDRGGEKRLNEVLDFQFDKCVKEQFCSKLDSLTLKEKVKFLARNVFGADTCNGSGYYKAAINITETENEIQFRLDPCGSGGRLIKAGGYVQMSYFQKIREKIENYSINASAHYLPLPEVLLERLFPVFVNHFTQRKPKALGRTGKSYAWSFDRSGVPYFCCQCAMAQAKYLNAGLSIIPPLGRKNACVWKINKKFLGLKNPP